MAESLEVRDLIWPWQMNDRFNSTRNVKKKHIQWRPHTPGSSKPKETGLKRGALSRCTCLCLVTGYGCIDTRFTWCLSDSPPDTQHAGTLQHLTLNDPTPPRSVFKQRCFWSQLDDFMDLVQCENRDDNSCHNDDTDDNRAGRSLK